jgi:thiamine-monophosphate kinase
MEANKQTTIADIGEDALIDRLTRDLPMGDEVIAGPGDDCAILQSASADHYDLLKTDCIIEGTHFLPDTPPAAIGWKAMARAISDIGAMGGQPRHALITLLIHGTRTVDYAEQIYQGLRRAAEKFHISIVGGETSAATQTTISITLTGQVEKSACITRSGGHPGDLIYVTGTLGDSFKSGHHLDFTPRLSEANWLAQNHPPHAMMDLSDGLAKDLPRLATASNCGYWIDPEKIPLTEGATLQQAIGEGEDYELLFTAPAAISGQIESAWPKNFPKLKLTQIGMLIANPADNTPLKGGWEHFQI